MAAVVGVPVTWQLAPSTSPAGKLPAVRAATVRRRSAGNADDGAVGDSDGAGGQRAGGECEGRPG